MALKLLKTGPLWVNTLKVMFLDIQRFLDKSTNDNKKASCNIILFVVNYTGSQIRARKNCTFFWRVKKIIIVVWNMTPIFDAPTFLFFT